MTVITNYTIFPVIKCFYMGVFDTIVILVARKQVVECPKDINIE